MISPTANDTMQLCELLKTRSCDAFAKLYDRYSAALYGIICRMVCNSNTGEELLQDVFVKVWKNIDKYDTAKGSLFTWLLQITRNTCIDYLRSKKHQPKFNGDPEMHHEKVNAQSEGHYNPENTELRSLAYKLDHKYRQVIDLVYFWGYSQEEVARLLDIPLGTVKTRSRAGLQQLRNLYNNMNAIQHNS
jgi:RNA polymerase sigma factor (sigma-70 family)